ncbi:MAG: methionine adenosyltransferase [Rhodospirillaceae bacterium]|nr:MAG: methionine adenosyltransferase [Rhodospirillaceae bacterium]
MTISISPIRALVGDALETEIVERKGLGHPDTICDEIAEEFSLALSRNYMKQFKEVLHHNVDKVLLVAGTSNPRFSGGEIVQPMRLILAGRATTTVGNQIVPVTALAQQSTSAWFKKYLPLVDIDNISVEVAVHPGSTDLTDLFARAPSQRSRLSNDTSCGVGYAPLSRLETIVSAVEKELGAAALGAHPSFGRDIKVMGIRRASHMHLTVSCAMVGRWLKDISGYLDEKDAIVRLARSIAKQRGADDVTVDVNVADDPDRGSIYLTVTGASAEAGDDGQTGRGNRVNGLITPYRPMTMESVAGKNPITHVGKLYNVLAGLIAQAIVDALPKVLAVEVYLVSNIGRPINEPAAVNIRVAPRDGSDIDQFSPDIKSICHEQLARLDTLWRDLLDGTIRIGRWPLLNATTK